MGIRRERYSERPVKVRRSEFLQHGGVIIALYPLAVTSEVQNVNCTDASRAKNVVIGAVPLIELISYTR